MSDPGPVPVDRSLELPFALSSSQRSARGKRSSANPSTGLGGTAVAVSLLVLASGCFPRLRAAEGVVSVRSGTAFVWMIRTPHGAALVDSGMEKDAAAIERALAEQGLAPDDVHTVLLTHGHVDHCAGAARFPKATVFVGEGDEGLLRGERAPANRFVRMLTAAAPRCEVPRKVQVLRDDATLDVDGERVEVVRTPGHTPGSVMYLARGVLFSGDSLLISGRHLRAANPLFSDAPDEARHSLAKLRGLTFQRVADGHFGVRDVAPGDLESALVSPLDRAPSP